ncbi:hypothetical protein BN903_35 [Halorubrum sp. AJ67]|nr:hypothetical protein BN903_35 [Halorubrum sp. AJ67]
MGSAATAGVDRDVLGGDLNSRATQPLCSAIFLASLGKCTGRDLNSESDVLARGSRLHRSLRATDSVQITLGDFSHYVREMYRPRLP